MHMKLETAIGRFNHWSESYRILSWYAFSLRFDGASQREVQDEMLALMGAEFSLYEIRVAFGVYKTMRHCLELAEWQTLAHRMDHHPLAIYTDL